MSAIFGAYKPLRNFLRECSLENTLIDVWQLSQHLSNKTAAPNQVGLPSYSLKGQVFPWEMPTIAREVLLHASPRGIKRLDSFVAIRKVVGHLRATRDEGSKLRLLGDGDIFNEVLRLSHQQFPWQQGNLLTSLIRHLKTFGSPEVAPLLKEKTGLTVREFFFLGFALSGHLLRRFDINSDQDYNAFGISRLQAQNFFSKLTVGIEEFRGKLDGFLVDASWDYNWNPLEATPLIAVDPSNPNRLYCPVPELLLRRFSNGLYYDLVGMANFGVAFGAAFEKYIGDVLSIAFPAASYVVHEETPYMVGKDQHHGPDWIVSGLDGNLFIECKTKRLTQKARFSTGDEELREDISKIASAVVQNYENVLEALEGKSKWQPNSQPCTPLVITFDDWFFLGPRLHLVLDAAVRERLVTVGLDVALISTMPYFVMSAREFELCAGAISEVGITAFFREKHDDAYRQWLWPEYQMERFPNAKKVNFFDAFESDWRKVFPELTWPKA